MTATSVLARPDAAIALDELARTLGGLSTGEVLVIGEALARILAATHRSGVVHGGVDPHNVLLTADGEPTLEYRAAAPEFQPPEATSDGLPTRAADLYGLGAVLHFGLTGTPPAGRSGGRTDALSVLVSDLLRADPAGRPDAATAAVRLAALLAEDRPPPTPRPPRRPATPLVVLRPEPPPSPRRLVLTTAAAVIVVALAGFGLALSLGGPAAEPAAAAPVDPRPHEKQERPVADVAPVELTPPRDDGDSVRLRWRSAEDLDFAVVVAEAGAKQPTVLLAQRERSMRVPVEVGKEYCFVVQATDGSTVYETDPKPIRGASCRD